MKTELSDLVCMAFPWRNQNSPLKWFIFIRTARGRVCLCVCVSFSKAWSSSNGYANRHTPNFVAVREPCVKINGL